jgi:hypothetical protein
MTAWFAVVTGAFGILGTVGGIVGSVSAVRAASSRRYAERGLNAAALLDAIDKTDDTKFLSADSRTRLRLELNRVVRESAAVYAKQYPTPAGPDFPRFLVAAYGTFLLAAAVLLVVLGAASASAPTRAVYFIFAFFSFLLTVACGVLAMTLWDRMQRRNDARELSGTPGRERYFEMFHDVRDTIRRHRIKRGRQQS